MAARRRAAPAEEDDRPAGFAADNHRARRFYERTGWTQGTQTGTAAWPPYPTKVDHRRALNLPR